MLFSEGKTCCSLVKEKWPNAGHVTRATLRDCARSRVPRRAVPIYQCRSKVPRRTYDVAARAHNHPGIDTSTPKQSIRHEYGYGSDGPVDHGDGQQGRGTNRPLTLKPGSHHLVTERVGLITASTCRNRANRITTGFFVTGSEKGSPATVAS